MNNLIAEFRGTCRVWYSHRKDGTHCWQARQRVYKGLERQYGGGAILRHVRQIKNILDKHESQIRQELPQ